MNTDEAIVELEDAYEKHIRKLTDFIRLRKQETEGLKNTMDRLNDELATLRSTLDEKVASHTASSGELNAEIMDLKKQLEDFSTGLTAANDKVKEEVKAFETFDEKHRANMNIGGKRMKRRSRRFGRERKSRRK